MMHEIRNPLEALGHLTYLALKEKNDPDKVEKYMLLANSDTLRPQRMCCMKPYDVVA